ncbi:MAG: MBL fold metallo-hydrolase [Oscillospiraceae bacterium]|nr:MBL fold metallo-hydrolase [Oscillospiraceae bacterium]
MSKDLHEIRAIDRKYRRRNRRTAFRRKWPVLLTAILLPLIAALCLFVYLEFTKQRAVMPSADTAVIRFLDVGQGDAMLIQTAEYSVLIDAGDRDHKAELVQMLRDAGVKRIDCIINSHPHSDHIGGLPAVLEAFSADEICLPDIPEPLLPTGTTFQNVLDLAEDKQIPVHTPKCFEKRMFGELTVEFLSVDNSGFDDLNDCSLGVRVTFGDVSLFAAGDLEANSEEVFRKAGLLQPANILKVSHHGAATSSTAPFLEAISPETAVISCGAFNDYGHPALKAMQRLHDAGCAVYRTDLDGIVCFVTDGRQYHIS